MKNRAPSGGLRRGLNAAPWLPHGGYASNGLRLVKSSYEPCTQDKKVNVQKIEFRGALPTRWCESSQDHYTGGDGVEPLLDAA